VGIRDWSVYFSESCGISLGIKDRQAGNAHAPLNLAEGCGARYLIVWSDGLVSRGSLERRQLVAEPLATLDQARAAAYDDPDAAQVLGPAEVPDVKIHDLEVASLARGETERLAQRLQVARERIDAGDFRTWSGSFSARETSARLITSAGLDVSGKGSSAGWYVTLNGELGDGHAARSLESDAEYEARLERLIRRAGELQQQAKPMAGGTHRVLLHPKVVEEYVLGTLLDHLSGSTVAHGEGHFRREQFGSDRPVLREDLSLTLDPLQPLKSGSYRFTTSGLPADRCSFIEGGRLIQPILDLKYARRLGLAPTPVPYAMDTLRFQGARATPLPAARKIASGGALILSVLGVHTQDGSSGDFSLAAPLALRIEDGEYAGRMSATLSGNLFEILLSDDLEFVPFEGESSPGLLVTCRLDPSAPKG